MSPQSRTPVVSLEIVEYLERLYPNRYPDPVLPERMVWWKAGQAELVQKLRQQYQLQTRIIPQVR